MAIYGKFRISNSRSTLQQENGVKVYLAATGQLLGVVSPSVFNPLKYCRERPKSRYTAQLVAILRQHDVTEEELCDIMSLKDKGE